MDEGRYNSAVDRWISISSKPKPPVIRTPSGKKDLTLMIKIIKSSVIKKLTRFIAKVIFFWLTLTEDREDVQQAEKSHHIDLEHHEDSLQILLTV